MAAQHTEDMVITVGEWVDQRTGEKRYRNMTIGRVFVTDTGRRFARIDCMPTGKGAQYWDGAVSFFEKRESQGN